MLLLIDHNDLLMLIICNFAPQQKFVRCSVRAEVRHLRKVLCHRLNVEKHQVSRDHCCCQYTFNDAARRVQKYWDTFSRVAVDFNK